jgi:hypothetical protein
MLYARSESQHILECELYVTIMKKRMPFPSIPSKPGYS